MKPRTFLIFLFLFPGTALAQEAVRRLEGAGQYPKYLTPGQLDTWIFAAEKGETIMAYVATREFDSILELAVKGDKEDKVLFAIDDEGSDSRFAFRVPEKGEYRIRVHAFKYAGGGNYVLQVRRFQAKPLQLDKPLIGTFDHEGKSYLYFSGSQDQILVPELKGTGPSTWKMLDVKGREMQDWAGAVLLEEDGEYSLMISSGSGPAYDLLVRTARQREAVEGAGQAGRLQQGEMDVWNFQGQPGEFRLLEVEKKGELAARLIYAPLLKTKEQRLARPGDLPEIRFTPVASRGGHLRFAALLGRTGRYQLQLLAQTPTSYTLSLGDPTLPLERDRAAEGHLPVGGSVFYSFKAVPGQLVQTDLRSDKFVPVLHLYDSRGTLVDKNDANTDGQESRITHMVLKGGLYRLHVASLGDGGGGDFRLTFQDRKVKELAVGGKGQGTLRPNSPDFWSFAGKEGQTVFLSVRSAVCDPVVSVRSPDGVQLVCDENRSPGTDSLQSVRLPRTGRYTLWISSRRGEGDYTLRVIDGD